MCVGDSVWAFVHVNERESEKFAKNLPCQHKTRKHVWAGRHVTRRHSGWVVAFVFHTVSFSQAVSLSFSLSLWGVITVVGSSRVGKRFSFPLSLPPSKLCTGYYRDLFTKCSFCLFLSSPLCPQSLHFSLKFSAAPSILFETQCVSLCTDWCLHPPVLLFLP